ncbi:MAG: redoxin domain-containing protein [Kofleriaceae bacterium]
MRGTDDSSLRPAPEWDISQWFNTDESPSVASLRGNVIVVHAFQMLCPGCVMRGIPQMQRVNEMFRGPGLKVIGLHTVFEHHAAMTPTSLEAFLHEYRITFPVGVDRPSDEPDGIPVTMRRYAMRGTPTTILIDAAGRLRRQVFGAHEDLALGAEIAALLIEAEQHKLQPVSRPAAASAIVGSEAACEDGECAVPARSAG